MKSLTFLCVSVCILLSMSCNSSHEKTASDTTNYIDVTGFDSGLKPGDNFFLYANGKWFDTVKISPTEMGTGSFFDLETKSRSQLKSILDSLSASNNKMGSIEQKVGDFYASGMDSATIEKRGFEPVQPYLHKIDSIQNINGVMQFAAEQQTENNGVLFGEYVNADDKNSAKNIAVFYQSGLGLPDRDYYFRKDASTLAIVDAYKKYMQQLFVLTGDDSSTAQKKAMLVYDLEKQMAASHKTNVELRDPQANYNRLLVANLDKQMPAFAWKNTLATMGITADSVNVQQLAFFSKVNQLLKSVPIDTWKTYLRLHILDNMANTLSSPFVNARFNYIKTITGQQELRPRWERMVTNTDANLGEALGQLYVKKYFSENAKERMQELVNNLQKSFEARISKLDWMSDSTKAKARDKLYAFIKKIGYPDKWRDYSNVTIYRDKYFENLISAEKNEYQYQLAKVGKPVDKTEWGMTPPTINAYYNPTVNEIVFPAGILQYPFFDANADDAINYGGIGAVIGHEMTHGFDDEGSQYDKEGNLKNWWSKEDNTMFTGKTKSVIDQYNTFTVLDTMHIQGALTNGENIADIGGLAIAYDAFKMTEEGQDTTRINGLTPDQRFFLSFAQIWKIKMKDELVRTLINTNPHSPEMWRVNGPLMNFTPFYEAFNVKPGEKMYKPDSARIKIW